MPPSAQYAHKVVAHILLVPDLDGIIYTFEQLIVPLDVLSNGVGNDALAIIDHNCLVNAF